MTVAVRDAATVMLVRDGDDGIEVFMVRRHPDSVFGPGAYVFPGGAVDEADRHADLGPVCEGVADADASTQLGVDEGGLAFWVAGIRECFEEAGFLLAYGEDDELVSFDDPAVAERFAVHRQAIDSGKRRLVDVCREEGLRLAADGLSYFSHWITPAGAPRRFDTRFFVAAAPTQQTPLHDAREVVSQEWLRPADALARNRAGQLELMFPTMTNLDALSRFRRRDELLAAAAAGPPPDAQPPVWTGARG